MENNEKQELIKKIDLLYLKYRDSYYFTVNELIEEIKTEIGNIIDKYHNKCKNDICYGTEDFILDIKKDIKKIK
jgi:hypothetical protein